jgi:V/A-type H+-transporting ATPase subunit E
MHGIENIINKIISDAKAEAAEVVAAAKGEAEGITSAAEKAAQAKANDIIERAKADMPEVRRRRESVAELEARKAQLAVKQELLKESFDKARETLLQMDGERYTNLLSKLAAEAAPNGFGEIILSAKDREAYGKEVVKGANKLFAAAGIEGKMTLSEQTQEVAGGLVVKQGQIETNCLIDTLLRLGKEELSSQIAGTLF